MSTRKHPFLDGEIYHLYNRGNNKNEIFHDKQDYEYFVRLLNSMNSEKRIISRVYKDSSAEILVSIGAYCFMPNHFHALVKQEKENGISRFMQKITTAYVMYYNKKYKRSGALFEGKFKSNM